MAPYAIGKWNGGCWSIRRYLRCPDWAMAAISDDDLRICETQVIRTRLYGYRPTVTCVCTIYGILYAKESNTRMLIQFLQSIWPRWLW